MNSRSTTPRKRYYTPLNNNIKRKKREKTIEDKINELVKASTNKKRKNYSRIKPKYLEYENVKRPELTFGYRRKCKSPRGRLTK